MRLLHAITLELREFAGDKIPKYAILSHTWEGEEVSFQDIQSTGAKRKAGFAKIKHAADQAARDGLKYIWVDTCCIDKSSSAELSEAINSMYRWYQNASVCYAYLADVCAGEEPSSKGSAFARSRWFTRGWTLQELIAPLNLVFFAGDWKKIGTKSALEETISAITGIDIKILQGDELESVSIARRMSWASRRKTTRVEDSAYCLMGLFRISMPLLYGEGKKAFLRLQEEIIKVSDDQSLFAWADRTASPRSYRGLLAGSPAEFVDSHNIRPIYDLWNSDNCSITNKGLKITLSLMPPGFKGIFYYAGLGCQRVTDPGDGGLGRRCCVLLAKLVPGGNQYARVMTNVIETFSPGEESRCEPMDILIKQTPLIPISCDRGRTYGFLIHPLPTNWGSIYPLSAVFPRDNWNPETRVLQLAPGDWIPRSQPYHRKCGALLFGKVVRKCFVVYLAIVFENGRCHVSIGVDQGFRDAATLEAECSDVGFLDSIGPTASNGTHTISVSVKHEVILGRRMFVVYIMFAFCLPDRTARLKSRL